MSQFIKFYFTSSMLNMFRTLIHPSSGPCDFFYCITTLVVCSCFDVCWGFSVAGLGWYPSNGFQPATRIPPQRSHTETPTHIETRTHNQCGDTIKKSQSPDDGCINVRNMLSVEEVKSKLINSDIKLVSYSSRKPFLCVRELLMYLFGVK